MIHLSTAELSAWVGQFLWPFIRISTLFMFMPLIGATSVPARVRLVMGLSIAFLIMNIIPAVPVVEPLSIEALGIMIHELAIGLTGALLLQIFMATFTTAGQMMSMQMGLGMAVMVDPVNGVSIPILAQFFQLLSFLMFLSLNGHLIVIELLINSFYLLPVSADIHFSDSLDQLIKLGAWMFSSALLISLPAITAMMVVNFTFGVMNRAAPQLNVFSLGFPMSMLCGLLALLLSVANISGIYLQLTEESMALLRAMWGQ
ncbi:flagellar biosynthetic protein FliR [Endozoicomonas numazuensis]|uniref:Flagellar biosynthetic protein FliR n=1 Tax=Endozoicomonas numazuensis TaxID=1137799 RepID=A0A081ND13_9GAMM|nr:flagellar biosynthetic protein FliR [Endozoicomonas numazuensis]KEQ16336.1 hypothetical protein GZ78_20865 [Endozoicomonas numazuensis]